MRRVFSAAAVLTVAAVVAVGGCASEVNGKASSDAAASSDATTPGGAATSGRKPDDRAAVLQAAQGFVADFLTNDPAVVDPRIVKLQAETTGKLGGLLSAPNALDNARQAAAKFPIRSSVEVRSVALESADADTASVLVSSVTTSMLPVVPGVFDKAETQRHLDRFRVTVERKGGAQLVSDFQEWSVSSKDPAPATLPAGAGADPEIREVARQYLHDGFSFAPATVDADRAKGRALLTPNMYAAYDQATRNAHNDIQYGGRSTAATPLAVGAVSVEGPKAVVLGFVDTVSEFTKSGRGPAQPSTGLIELARQPDGHWLVDKYTEVERPI